MEDTGEKVLYLCLEKAVDMEALAENSMPGDWEGVLEGEEPLNLYYPDKDKVTSGSHDSGYLFFLSIVVLLLHTAAAVIRNFLVAGPSAHRIARMSQFFTTKATKSTNRTIVVARRPYGTYHT